MKKTLLSAVIILSAFIVTAQTSNVGIGENNPGSKLSVKGGLSVGSGYSNTTAPSDGAILQGQVGIGTAAPNSKAILDVSSTTQGVYLPRLNNLQRNALTPALTSSDKGLIIFNTDNDRTEFWDGAAWIAIGEGAGGPPTGLAGGDLSGSSYPNPVIAAGAINSSKIADGSIAAADMGIGSVDLSTAVVAGTLPVSKGGTGAASFGTNRVLYGDGTNPIQTTSVPLAAQVLMGNAGQVPTFTTLAQDVTLGNTGNATVQGIQSRAVSANAPSGNDVLKWNGTAWTPAADANSGGTVTNIVTGTGLTGGPITGTGTISIATGGVTTTQIADGTIAAADLANTGVSAGTYNNVTVNTEGQVTAASNSAYLTGNQSITLSGDVSGTGTTAIATTIGAGAVTGTKIASGAVDLTTKVSGVLPIDNGGTNANSGNYSSGKFLAYDGTRLSSTGYDQNSFSPASGSGNYIQSQTAANQAAGFRINGLANVNNGSPYAVPSNNMTAGSFTIGGTNANYGGGTNWNSNTAGLLMECLDNTEIAVHDANDRVASLMYYEGAGTNRVTIGRSMYPAWGTLATVNINGNVGIGQPAPSAKLDVLQSGSSNEVAHFVQGTPASYNTDVWWKGGTATADWLLSKRTADASGDFWFFNPTLGYSVLTLKQSGNVGIGTTAPSNKLDVYGYFGIRGNTVLSSALDRFGGDATDIYGNIRVLRAESDLADGMYLGYGGSGGPLRLFSNSGTTEFMTIATSGNVGISSTSPAVKLQLNSNFSNLGGRLLTSNDGGWQADGTTPLVVISDSYTNTNHGYKIGIDLHNDDATTYGSYAPSILFSRRGASTSYNSAYAGISAQAQGQGSDGNWVYGSLVFYTAHQAAYGLSEKMRIDQAGNVGIGTSSPTHKLDVVGDINASGNISSPKFRITQVWNQNSTLPGSSSFTSGGGTVVIMASGSGFSSSSGIVGMNILVDGSNKGVAKSYTNETSSHKAFNSNFLVVSGLAAGSHTIQLTLISPTQTDFNDFFTVSVMELPF